MTRPPPLETGAADGFLALFAFVAAIVFGAAGVWYLLDGDGTGWILLLVALLPLLAGIQLRRRSRRRR